MVALAWIGLGWVVLVLSFTVWAVRDGLRATRASLRMLDEAHARLDRMGF